MKFSISADILQAGLTKVAKGLSDKSEYGKVIRLAATKDSIALVTTNGETDYRWTYTDQNHFQTDEAGEATLVAEKLLGASEYLKDQVTLSLEDNLVNVSAGKIHLEVKTADIDISIVPAKDPDIKFSFDTATEVPKIIHTMSDDPGKPKMLGLLIDLKSEGEEKRAVFKAVQPNRAARLDLTFESADSINKQVVIPCFVANLMASETARGISIGDNNTLIASFKNYEVRTPLTDIPFMNPDSAFSSKGTRTVKFARNELAKALRLLRASDKQNAIAKFNVGDDATEISVYTEQTGKSKVTVKSTASEKFNLSLNFKFVLDLLGSLDGDEEVEFRNEGKILIYKNATLHFVTTVFGA